MCLSLPRLWWFTYIHSTADFCSTGCQSNCGSPIVPVCGQFSPSDLGVDNLSFIFHLGADADSALTRRIGYYNGAAASRYDHVYLKGGSLLTKTRSCMAFPPEQIYTEDLTHVNFAFAYISEYV